MVGLSPSILALVLVWTCFYMSYKGYGEFQLEGRYSREELLVEWQARPMIYLTLLELMGLQWYRGGVSVSCK